MPIHILEVLHPLMHIMALPIAIIMSWWYGNKYGYNTKKAISYSFVMTLVLVAFSYACVWIPKWLGYTVFLNSARSYIFIPLFAFLMSKPWKIPLLQGLDFLAPIVFFIRAFVLIGCTLLGCGLAVPCDWGIYSPSQDCIVFPMDLFDLLGSLVAGVVSLLYAKKLKYDGSGRVFALALGIMGFVRLFIQFGSREIWWGIVGLNDETVYSVIAIVISTMIYSYHRKTMKGTD